MNDPRPASPAGGPVEEIVEKVARDVTAFKVARACGHPAVQRDPQEIVRDVLAALSVPDLEALIEQKKGAVAEEGERDV